MDPITADRFRSDLGIASKTVNAGVSTGQAQGANTSLEKWSSFFHELAINTLLETIVETISILQVFAQRVRTRDLAANQNPMRA